jgi:hypothetical protein
VAPGTVPGAKSKIVLHKGFRGLFTAHHLLFKVENGVIKLLLPGFCGL